LKVDPQTRRGRAVLELGAWLLRSVLRLLGSTWRYEVRDDAGVIAELVESPRAVVLCLWHDRSVIAAHFALRHLVRRGVPITVLASHSRDGELVARFARGHGLHVDRGSASRGGRQAVRAIYRSMTKASSSPLMAADGPRGPQYHFKVGTVVLAQASRAPVVHLGFAPERAWALGSWDRLLLPKPGSRVVLTVEREPDLPATTSSDELEALRRRLEDHLADVTGRAEAEVGMGRMAERAGQSPSRIVDAEEA
jgi:lysophospholipid acyltransferase (LPLAT)-like uncharacterized protein